MFDHPQTRQLRGAQLVEKVVAQFAALDGAQVARVHADALSEGFLGDAVGLELGEEFIQRDACQIGLQFWQAADLFTLWRADLLEADRIVQKGTQGSRPAPRSGGSNRPCRYNNYTQQSRRARPRQWRQCSRRDSLSPWRRSSSLCACG